MLVKLLTLALMIALTAQPVHASQFWHRAKVVALTPLRLVKDWYCGASVGIGTAILDTYFELADKPPKSTPVEPVVIVHPYVWDMPQPEQYIFDVGTLPLLDEQ